MKFSGKCPRHISQVGAVFRCRKGAYKMIGGCTLQEAAPGDCLGAQPVAAERRESHSSQSFRTIL
jgi:hypothetical protein